MPDSRYISAQDMAGPRGRIQTVVTVTTSVGNVSGNSFILAGRRTDHPWSEWTVSSVGANNRGRQVLMASATGLFLRIAAMVSDEFPVSRIRPYNESDLGSLDFGVS